MARVERPNAEIRSGHGRPDVGRVSRNRDRGECGGGDDAVSVLSRRWRDRSLLGEAWAWGAYALAPALLASEQRSYVGAVLEVGRDRHILCATPWLTCRILRNIAKKREVEAGALRRATNRKSSQHSAR